MSVKENIQNIRKQLPEDVKLICVSKFHSNETILEAYNAGERLFGESRAQEVRLKYESLPKDIEWHFIGHLQKNKVKYIAPFVSLIHSVDGEDLLSEINRCAEKNNRKINVLLQVHIAQEEQKFGFFEQELYDFLEGKVFQKYPFVKICGLMGMATFTENETQIEKEFSVLNEIFRKVKNDYFCSDDDFCELSMGMSDDFPIAVLKGSTMVRIGSLIFGERG
ncbi:MAG: YggS family pyridoxal phosphate-dependent enzyme [Paludibacteraceae bacterium]|nr:YggS family pyridoxal phosphate-dependent enzyme [Paludibacteraceae bacterium]MBO7315809.1 YggS family pyridoxal phosphate-dependent enzyme [Paludibacteraceae bacterium]